MNEESILQATSKEGDQRRYIAGIYQI